MSTPLPQSSCPAGVPSCTVWVHPYFCLHVKDVFLFVLCEYIFTSVIMSSRCSFLYCVSTPLFLSSCQGHIPSCTVWVYPYLCHHVQQVFLFVLCEYTHTFVIMSRTCSFLYCVSISLPQSSCPAGVPSCTVWVHPYFCLHIKDVLLFVLCEYILTSVIIFSRSFFLYCSCRTCTRV